jgi:hypothetical protein
MPESQRSSVQRPVPGEEAVRPRPGARFIHFAGRNVPDEEAATVVPDEAHAPENSTRVSSSSQRNPEKNENEGSTARRNVPDEEVAAVVPEADAARVAENSSGVSSSSQHQRDPENDETERPHEVVATLVEERSCYLVALPHEESPPREDHFQRGPKRNALWLAVSAVLILAVVVLVTGGCSTTTAVRGLMLDAIAVVPADICHDRIPGQGLSELLMASQGNLLVFDILPSFIPVGRSSRQHA